MRQSQDCDALLARLETDAALERWLGHRLLPFTVFPLYQPTLYHPTLYTLDRRRSVQRKRKAGAGCARCDPVGQEQEWILTWAAVRASAITQLVKLKLTTHFIVITVICNYGAPSIGCPSTNGNCETGVWGSPPAGVRAARPPLCAPHPRT
jgi:hypothetical protein